MTNRRFLSLWLPRLATDRARRAHKVDVNAPLAVVATIKNARRLVGVDVRAARLGLTAGLTLADARARHPALVVAEADPAAEKAGWSASPTPARAIRRWSRSTGATA